MSLDKLKSTNNLDKLLSAVKEDNKDPSDKKSYVELDYQKCYGDDIDYDYLCNKIKYAWNNREELSNNAREWYMEYCR